MSEFEMITTALTFTRLRRDRKPVSISTPHAVWFLT